MSDEVVITMADEHVPSAPRALRNVKREKYDELRRPQAAVLYRELKLNSLLGLSWRECWALGEGNEQWDVGPIVVWMRAHGVWVDARYDVVVGETRFYLIEDVAGLTADIEDPSPPSS